MHARTAMHAQATSERNRRVSTSRVELYFKTEDLSAYTHDDCSPPIITLCRLTHVLSLRETAFTLSHSLALHRAGFRRCRRRGSAPTGMHPTFNVRCRQLAPIDLAAQGSLRYEAQLFTHVHDTASLRNPNILTRHVAGRRALPPRPRCPLHDITCQS